MRNAAPVAASSEWEPLAAAHAARADSLTAGHRERTERGESHAIEDFLYDYYSTRPSLLRRWHPGPGIVLADAPDHATWKYYRTDAGLTRMDAAAFMAARGAAVDWIERLLTATAGRQPRLGCFGLHEWAMAYRAGAELRHPLPLRLGQAGTDAVVESHPIACSHIDAFRFFTPEAVPLNLLQPTRDTQVEFEQPGCLHATMDLYKWAARLAPAVPSELALDAFELALEVRRVDMRASPYDVSGFGLAAIAIETPTGKREYADHQRDFAERGGLLRERLLAAIAALRAHAAA